MSTLEFTALAVSSLCFIVGLITSLLPVIPGSCIVWMGILVHKLWMGDASVSWQLVLITAGITLLGLLADIFMGIWGARRFGASWKGALGAFIGALVALFIPPQILWLIIGPVIGAILGELLAGRSFKAGGKAGIGTVIGGIVAFLLKFALTVSVIAMFYFSLLMKH